ncbi:unnamed protein product, partial [Prorocentrum cordatum]
TCGRRPTTTVGGSGDRPQQRPASDDRRRSTGRARRRRGSEAAARDLAVLSAELAAAAESFDVVLVVGLRPPLGALLAARLDCFVHAIDAGGFALRRPSSPLPPPAPLATFCSGGAELCEALAEPWGGHPRPQLRRAGAGWRSLNGRWEAHVTLADDASPPVDFSDGFVEVPFPAESSRSGFGRRVSEHEALWLRRQVEAQMGRAPRAEPASGGCRQGSRQACRGRSTADRHGRPDQQRGRPCEQGKPQQHGRDRPSHRPR